MREGVREEGADAHRGVGSASHVLSVRVRDVPVGPLSVEPNTFVASPTIWSGLSAFIALKPQVRIRVELARLLRVFSAIERAEEATQ